jgi:hypothetical protein
MHNVNTPHEVDSKLPDVVIARSPDTDLLRGTALIFFFLGLFSFVRTILSPLGGGFFLDPRIVNIFVASGLVARKRAWYIVGLISAGANLGWHIFHLTESANLGTWTAFYFLLATFIDGFQLYALSRKRIRAWYFTPKDKQ